MRAHYFLLAACGVVISTQSPFLPDGSVLALAASLAVAAAYWGFRSHARYWQGLICLSVGVLLGFSQGHRLQANSLPQALDHQHVQWQGCVLEPPAMQQRAYGMEWRFLVQVHDDGLLQALNGHRVQVSTTADASAVQAGNCYAFDGRLKRPRGFSSPGAASYDGWLLGQGIRALARVKSLRHLPGQHLPMARTIPVTLHSRWVRRIKSLSVSTQSRQLMLAILAGDTAALQTDDWDTLQATGTTHLFVVSGLHIGLAASLGFMVAFGLGAWLRAAGMPWRARSVGLAGAMITAWLFCMASGSGVAAVRSSIMLSCALLGLLLGRPKVLATSVAFSAFLIVLLNPWAIYLPGFWLSFAAVTCLWMVLALRQPLPGYVMGLGYAQWAIGLGLLPLLLVLGKPLSGGSALINMLAVPVVSLWVPVLLAVVIVPLPEWLLAWLDLLNQSLWSSLQWMASVIGSTHWWPVPSVLAAGFMLFAVLCWLLPCHWRVRCLLLMALLPWWFPLSARIHPGDFEIHVMDVGQGQAVLVQTANHRLLYDAGPASPTGWTTAQAVVWPMLGTLGIHALDRIVISHADNDHAGGLPWMLERFPAADILQTGLPGVGHHCLAGEQWEWDDVRFSVLHPGKAAGTGNNASCVLRIDNGHFVALLPGDIEREAELALLNTQPKALKADWLLAPHHGSRTSSSWPFAKAVRPAQVIYSAGFQSRFGHPADDVVMRWHQLGSQSLKTASCGTYTVRVAANGNWQQRCHRKEARPWWRDP